jgi:hypothetical protein
MEVGNPAIKCRSKARGSERLKLKHDELPSTFAFKLLNLRFYTTGIADTRAAYGRLEVGRCRLTPC